jgi:hypothetical protein
MTQPLIQTVAITRGDDYSATVTFDQPVAGFAEMRFTIREDWARAEADNTEAALSVTLTGSGIYTATLSLTSAQTLALQFDQYVYDVAVVTSAGSKRYTAQRGMLRIAPDVTRG